MELTIDGVRCDLGTQRIAVPGYDAGRLADIDACREGRTLTLTIPATPRNDAALRFARDPYASPRFGEQIHTARISHEDATLLEGTVRLMSASDEEFRIEIREGGTRWAEQAARRMLDTLGIDYLAALTPTTILESWTADTLVRFLPVQRDAYPQQSNPQDLLPAERMPSTDDYHPYLHIAPIVERIFAEAGYTVESRFLRSEFFRSLCMSGAYASTDTSAAEARMGFFARRLGPATAAANSSGRVYADPKALYNTVGNIVETATPQTPDADGEPVPELTNNGGCFAVRDGAIGFTPLAETNVGFEFHLRYTTDHRILSRTRLKGFDSVYLGPGSEMRFALTNRYKDRRSELAANRTYRIVVFDHTEGSRYRLTCTRDGAAGVQWGEFAARSAQVTTPASGNCSDPVLLAAAGSGWVPCASDWALYDGHIGETGQTVVELRVRTASERIAAGTTRKFDQIYLFGADPGMSVTLHKECSLRPVFRSGPGFGSSVRFADMVRHGIRQAELLRALAHLFNLRFHTDEATRTVRIEPSDDFFGSGPEADWRTKSDLSQPVVREDIATGMHERRTWRYREGDGAVARFDAENDEPLGAWSFEAPSRAALQGEEVRTNPLFRPTLNAAGHYLNAPSALLMQVGDRDDLSPAGSEVSPRIVRYAGMHSLPPGERWGYPSQQNAYPLAAFHFAGDGETDGFTLCFEDRDGLRGLNRYLERQARTEGSLERITLSLRIAPHEFEALLTPGTGAPDIRSVFRIETGCGAVAATLHRIEAYDPEAASVRCTFTRLPEDRP